LLDRSATLCTSATSAEADARRIERLASPCGREVAPLHQLEPGAAQALHRPVFVGVARPECAAATTQRTPDAFGRLFQLALEPSVERLREQPLRLTFGEDAEQRIHAGLDRTLTKEVGAEAVDGADVRLLEVLHRGIEACSGGGVARRSSSDLETLAKAQLQLAGRLLGEGHRDNLAHFGTARLDDAHDALDERGGLARPRRRFDDERFVDRIGNQRAGFVVGHLRTHGCFRISSRSASRSCGFSRDAPLHVRSAHRLELAAGAGLRAGCGGEEPLRHCPVDDAQHVDGRGSRSVR
jgi:hypothetical protein